MIERLLRLVGLRRGTTKIKLLFPRTVKLAFRENCVAKAARPATWGDGHSELLVEFDEPFPLFGLPNPRRSEWVHDSWIKEIQ